MRNHTSFYVKQELFCGALSKRTNPNSVYAHLFLTQVIAHNDSFDLVLNGSFIVSRKYIFEKCELLYLCFSLHLKLHIDRRFCIV